MMRKTRASGMSVREVTVRINKRGAAQSVILSRFAASFPMLYLMADVRPHCSVKRFPHSAIARMPFSLPWSRMNSCSSKQHRADSTVESSEVPFMCKRADRSSELIAFTKKSLQSCKGVTFRVQNPVQIRLQTSKNLSQISHISKLAYKEGRQWQRNNLHLHLLAHSIPFTCPITTLSSTFPKVIVFSFCPSLVVFFF